MLIKNGARINARSKTEGKTPMQCVDFSKITESFEFIGLLFDLGGKDLALINDIDNYGYSLLHRIIPDSTDVQTQGMKLIDYLLQCNFTFKFADTKGLTPLMYAMVNKKFGKQFLDLVLFDSKTFGNNARVVLKMIDILIDTDGKKNNIIMKLIESSKRTSIVSLMTHLLDVYKFDINQQNNNGETALILAIKHGNDETIERNGLESGYISLSEAQFCIRNGANIHICDNFGDNAIIKAMKQWEKNRDEILFSAMVKMLISKGADCKHRNRNGQNAICIAQKYEKESKELMELMQTFSDSTDSEKRDAH